MKRFTFFARTLLFAAAFTASASVTMPAAFAQAVTIVVGGQGLNLDPGPIERAGRVFVPLRGIFERLGATVVYSNGTINATKGRTTVSLLIGSTNATINGQTQTLDVAPFIVGATTYVPLRFIAQSLGAVVNYSDSTRVVAISMGGHAPPYNPPPRPVPPPPNPMVFLVASQPEPGSSVVDRFVTIAARFSRPVAPGTVRVWLDGNDVSYRSGINSGGFSYKPPAPLAFGSHTVRVAGGAGDGSRFDRSWSFRTAGAPPPVSPIELRAPQPGPGTTITNRFAVIAAQFSRAVDADTVRVWLDGASITNRSGVSSSGFSYKPPAPLAFGSHTVRVAGNGPGGMAPFDRSWNFTVKNNAPVNVHLRINAPASDATVARTFVVSGNTIANARVRLTAGSPPGATGQFTGTATAGPRGNFAIKVTLGTLLGQQAVRLHIVATDPVSGQAADTYLQLRLK